MGRKTDNDPRIERVVEDAEEAFWAQVARLYPEIKTGEFPPECAFKLKDAMHDAVRAWLDLNRPAPTTARCDLTVEMRPPKKGERGYMVESLTAEEALREILRESEELGWIAQEDYEDTVDDCGMHAVTITLGGGTSPTMVQTPDRAPELKPPVTELPTAKGRKLGAWVDGLPGYKGWKAYWEYPGFVSWAAGFHLTVSATPDYNREGYIDIQVTDDDGHVYEVPGVPGEVHWPDGVRSEREYMVIMEPILDTVAAYEKEKRRRFKVEVTAITRSVGDVIFEVAPGELPANMTDDELKKRVASHVEDFIADDGITIKWATHDVIWPADEQDNADPFTLTAPQLGTPEEVK